MIVKIHQHVKFQAIPFSMHSPANARKPLRTDGRTEGHAVKQLRLVRWTNGPMYRSKEGISGFGRTDGQPEYIMPPVPKGGGIITTFTRTTFETPKYPRRPRDQYTAQIVNTLELSGPHQIEFKTRTRWRRVKTLGQHQVGVNLQSHAQHQLWISTWHIFHEFHKIMPG